MSYYRDTGSKAWPEPGYGAHNGDSESIGLDVYYHFQTSHWVLGLAQYSRHGEFAYFDRGSNAYPRSLTYPDHPGTYPRSWVAEGKHANYASQRACTGGGVLGNDTCVDSTQAARVEGGAVLNVGARYHHSPAQTAW